MNSFEQRERAYENKFVHDQEIEFKVHAKKTRLLALWAAKLMNMNEERAKKYASNLVNEQIFNNDNANIITRIHADLHKKGIIISEQEIHTELENCFNIAKNSLN